MNSIVIPVSQEVQGKVTEIIHLLDGLSFSQIEEILDRVKHNVQSYPISIKGQS